MSSFRSRRFIFAFVAFAVVVGSLLASEPALADTALFRVEQRWHNFPNPPVTTPGHAGMDQGYIQPYTTRAKTGEYIYPPATAIVEPGNPVGGVFTLPTGFLDFSVVGTLTAKTAWPGYTTTYYYWAYNGPGKFEPGFGSTASHLRLVFPTTGGNPWYPNYGLGSPLTPTTTFDGRYDMSREGSIRVTPGPNRFGGTFRLFFYPEAHWDQYIFYFSPALYQGYGSYLCFDDGMYDCTPDTSASEPGTTAKYLGVWWLLTEKGKAKATTPIPGPRYDTYARPPSERYAIPVRSRSRAISSSRGRSDEAQQRYPQKGRGPTLLRIENLQIPPLTRRGRSDVVRPLLAKVGKNRPVWMQVEMPVLARRGRQVAGVFI